MKGLVLSILAGAIAFVILLQIIPSNLLDFSGGTTELVLLGLLVGVVNAVIKPVVKLLSFPINLMTLGLFGFVVNAVMLLFVAWLTSSFTTLDFTVGNYPHDLLSSDTIVGAFIGSILLSIINSIVGLVVHD